MTCINSFKHDRILDNYRKISILLDLKIGLINMWQTIYILERDINLKMYVVMMYGPEAALEFLRIVPIMK